MPRPLLQIANLADRHIGVTSEMAAFFYQAACSCFQRHHESPASFAVRDDDEERQVVLKRGVPTERRRFRIRAMFRIVRIYQ
jgi:hypothetical protein